MFFDTSLGLTSDRHRHNGRYLIRRNTFSKLEKKIEEATRWIETINQYIEIYEKAVKQYEKMVESVTNLRGILDKVDEQIMRHKQLITTYALLDD